MRGLSARMGDVPAGFREFVDRRAAGRRLADRLESYRGHDLLVLGIPRGGVAVAAEMLVRLGPIWTWSLRERWAPPYSQSSPSER